MAFNISEMVSSTLALWLVVSKSGEGMDMTYVKHDSSALDTFALPTIVVSLVTKGVISIRTAHAVSIRIRLVPVVYCCMTSRKETNTLFFVMDILVVLSIEVNTIDSKIEHIPSTS